MLSSIGQRCCCWKDLLPLLGHGSPSDVSGVMAGLSTPSWDGSDETLRATGKEDLWVSTARDLPSAGRGQQWRLLHLMLWGRSEEEKGMTEMGMAGDGIFNSMDMGYRWTGSASGEQRAGITVLSV